MSAKRGTIDTSTVAAVGAVNFASSPGAGAVGTSLESSCEGDFGSAMLLTLMIFTGDLVYLVTTTLMPPW